MKSTAELSPIHHLSYKFHHLLTMAPTTTSFFFSSFDKIPTKDLVLQGDAYVGDDGLLSLTKRNIFNSVGRVLYSPSINFSDTDGQLIFDTTITFQIDHTGGAPAADGIAFFIAPVGTVIPQGASGGSLAIFDPSNSSENLFAVEFATFANVPRVGIDLGSRDSVKSINFKDYLGKKVTATIFYRHQVVTVVAVTDTETVTKTFPVSLVYNLKNDLDQYVQVGISASSGNCKENHYVYSWSFNSALVRDEKSGGSSK